MIDVFLPYPRYLEISREVDGDFDKARLYLEKWCSMNARFFYIGQRGYRDGELGFVFRFASVRDATKFKLTWG